jgi:hypothetical protein
MNDSLRPSLAFALGALSSLMIADATAQSCANPQHAFVNSAISGDTCGTNALPVLNHGTIDTPGGDAVFRVSGTYGVDGVIVHGDPNNTYVFVCSGCGVSAECVASAQADEDGMAWVAYPNDGRDYYVIVDSQSAACHDFTLQPVGPLEADP